MSVVGLSSERQKNVLGVISAILHLGNIQFVEDNNVAEVENPTGRRLTYLLTYLFTYLLTYLRT